MKDLAELIDDFCVVEDLTSLVSKLRLISHKVELISSRFIDIDPSAKAVDEISRSRFILMLNSSSIDESTIQDLLKIYDLFSTYLLMRDKFGEASDWYLKNEYDDYAAETIKKVLQDLSVYKNA